MTDAELKLQYFGHLMQSTDSLEKGTTEDEMAGSDHQLNGRDKQALGIGDGQGSLASCSPWSRKESDTTEQLN